MAIRKARGARGSDIAANIVIYAILTFIGVITLYPFLHTMAVSLNEGVDTARGGLTIYPRVFTLTNYKTVFADKRIPTSFGVSVARTVVGACGALIVTALFAYPLSKTYFKGRSIYMTLAMITMYFGGGLIPTYLVYMKLKLLNTFWIYVLPHMLSVYNMIIMRTYFKGIPGEIEESAFMDGAGHWRVFLQIIMPLSMPVIAVILLFNAVSQWNSWFDAFLYVRDTKLMPLQNILIEIINVNKMDDIEQMSTADITQMSQHLTTRSVTAAVMLVTCLPIILVYPFLQRYFVKGIMIGSVKG